MCEEVASVSDRALEGLHADLHQLVEQLPADQVDVARKFLRFLIADSDPFLQALAAAPEDDEAPEE